MLVASRELAEEIRDVLSRPKFDRYVTPQIRDEFLAALVAEAEFVEIVDRVDACRDPKDNKVLEEATNGHATCVISGDDDLIALHPFRGIPILSPADFNAHYEARQQ
jgi:putative PIN family toxin of toxin-antitoxin system